MVAKRARRQITLYTSFKLVIFLAISGFIYYLVTVEGVSLTLTPPPPPPAITTPPAQFSIGETVELSGSGNPGNVVRVYANDVALGDTMVRPSGRWQFDTFDLNIPGAYELRVAPLLPSGQVQYIETPELFTITIIDPYKPATVESTQQIGGLTRPLTYLTGRATPNTTILLKVEGRLLAIGVSNATGHWDMEAVLPSFSVANVTLETLDNDSRLVNVSAPFELEIAPISP